MKQSDMMPSAVAIAGIDFVAIPVRDLQASTRFYETVLGVRGDYRWADMGLEFQVGNVTLALMELERFGIPFRANSAPIALRVDDVATARARLEAAGIDFAEQFDSGVCHQAIFHDPDGNTLILHHRYAST
jgi:catechol 2,3-dioxygenase-like lactoylglutathione lyase family enzyme